MHVITKKHLAEAEKHYKKAAKEMRAWHAIVRAARWQTFSKIRQVFKDADAVDEYVVFNIRHNRYRLITIVHYSREREGRLTEGHIYIRSFLTHKDYDNRANWDRGVNQ